VNSIEQRTAVEPIPRLRDSVGTRDENVSRPEIDVSIVVVGEIAQTEKRTGRLEVLVASRAAEEHRRIRPRSGGGRRKECAEGATDISGNTPYGS